jgi:hypothetical protein
LAEGHRLLRAPSAAETAVADPVGYPKKIAGGARRSLHTALLSALDRAPSFFFVFEGDERTRSVPSVRLCMVCRSASILLRVSTKDTIEMMK